MNHLDALTNLWQSLISRARKDKEEKFARTARRVWDFIGKGYMDLYGPTVDREYQPFEEGGGPYFKARLNLSYQFLSVFLPHCHFRSPQRVVAPNRPEMPPELLSAITGQPVPQGTPMPEQPQHTPDTVRAWLMQWFLNYLPGEYNLRKEAALACQEALVKGRGVVWCELTSSAYGPVPGSFYDSVDGLLIDPAARTLRTADYIIRQRRANREELAEAMDLDPERLKHISSKDRDFELETQDTEGDEFKIDFDDSDSMVTYYEVYSRRGLGPGYAPEDEQLKELRKDLGDLADGPSYLVILPNVGFPLNLPPEVLEVGDEAEIRARLDWPIPFYKDQANPWPCSVLDFHPHTKDAWAKSPLEAALPLQVFLDQCYSFLMDRIAATSRQLIFVSKGLEDEVRQAIIEGFDRSVVPVAGDTYQKISEYVHVLQFPEVNKDIYTLIAMVQREFEEITGQVPLLQGSMGPTQARSSAEVQIRDAHASTRPDDYAEKTEEWHSQIARKEGFATRLLVPPPAALFGEQTQETEGGEVYGPFSQLWAVLVNTDDPDEAAAELDYTIEVGSGRKKNKEKMLQDVQMIGQTLVTPILNMLQQTGIGAQQYNAYVRLLGEASDQRLDDMMLPDLQAMQQQQSQEQAAMQQQAEQAAAEAERVKVELEMAKTETEKVKIVMEQLKIAAERAKIDMERAKLDTEEVKVELERAKAETERVKVKTERAKAKTAAAKPKEGNAA
jgi:hypothetical protein